MFDSLSFLKFKIQDVYHKSAGKFKLFLGVLLVVMMLSLAVYFWLVSSDISHFTELMMKSAVFFGAPLLVAYLYYVHYKKTFALTKDLPFFDDENI